MTRIEKSMLRVGVGLVLCAVTWAVAAKAPPSQALSLFDVAVSSDSFNPSQNRTVSIAYQLSQDAKVTVKLFDPDMELVRTLVADASRKAGRNEEAWDGKDDQGKIVPDEAYFFTIEAVGGAQVSNSVVYDPTTFSGGEAYDLTDVDYKRSSGTLNYRLPKPSRVLLRIGIKNGPLLRTLVAWKPRSGGLVTEYWNGKDADGLLDVWAQDRFSILVTYFTLPENSVIAFGNRDYDYYAYKAAQEKKRPIKAERSVRPGRRISSNYLRSRNEERLFNVGLSFPEFKLKEGELPEIKDRAIVRVDMAKEDRERVRNQQTEIILFVDAIFYGEEEKGHFPFNFPLEVNMLPPGEHVVTVNIATFGGQFGVRSAKFIVDKPKTSAE